MLCILKRQYQEVCNIECAETSQERCTHLSPSKRVDTTATIPRVWLAYSMTRRLTLTATVIMKFGWAVRNEVATGWHYLKPVDVSPHAIILSGRLQPLSRRPCTYL